jgi:hypothetical protein
MDNRVGNVLTDHPDVAKQSKIYPTIINDFVKVKEIPDTFDGRDIWGTYLVSPQNQKLSSWALVAKDVLNDRFCLQSGGQMMVNFDEFEIVSCMDIPPNKKVDGVLSYPHEYKNIYQGYSIYDAWEYIYKFGVCQQNCFSGSQLEKMKVDTPDKIIDYSDKIKEYGNECSELEDIGKTSCLTKVDRKPVARRAFFCDSIYNVGSDKTMKDKIQQIKAEIVRWGPVAAGFIVYENFMDKEWEGRTMYEKVEGKPLGGHYVSIVGYGKDYWICRNSWGTGWGLLGYFKIKFGIPECKLEDNVSACSPYLYKRRESENNVEGMKDGEKVSIFDMEEISPKLFKYRTHLRINFLLYYTDETIEAIRAGKLYGSLKPIIVYPGLLPDLNEFWVMDILDFNYSVMAEDEEKQHKNGKSGRYIYYAILFFSLSFLFIIGYLSVDKKLKKIKK